MQPIASRYTYRPALSLECCHTLQLHVGHVGSCNIQQLVYSSMLTMHPASKTCIGRPYGIYWPLKAASATAGHAHHVLLRPTQLYTLNILDTLYLRLYAWNSML